MVVAGFGQVGMAVARYLAGEHIPVLSLDLSTRRVTASRARGLPVYYGNATRIDVLRAAHLDRAHERLQQILKTHTTTPIVKDQANAIASGR